MNEQEAFWSGSFGTSYIDRNSGRDLIEANKALFAEVFLHTGEIGSVIELGANIGLNLVAIHEMHPSIRLEAVEINHEAAWTLANRGIADVHFGSLLRYRPQRTCDLSFTKGVLIHLAVEDRPAAYDVLYKASHEFVLMAEYFAPENTEIEYRGNRGKLFKADFGTEFQQRFPDVELVSKWFVGKDQGQDSLTVWLMEKIL